MNLNPMPKDMRSALDRFEASLEALRAVAEPTRLRLIWLLSHEELSVMELVDILGQSQPRISRHLKLLSEAGLTERFPEGAFVYYRLAGPAPRQVLNPDLMTTISADLVIEREGLERVRKRRKAAAESYFETIAPEWDRIRALHISEARVESELMGLVKGVEIDHLVDLGTGSGRMLTLFGPQARQMTGLDLSQNMLNLARMRVDEAGFSQAELRHGDITETRLIGACADMVIIHQVLHFLHHPRLAISEAARLLRRDGSLIIVDFAPHELTRLAQDYQHQRLGIDSSEIRAWAKASGLRLISEQRLVPNQTSGLDVMIWRLCATQDTQNLTKDTI